MFKLLLPIYTYNSTYKSCLYLLLRSPPLASILVSLSLHLSLPLLLPFPLALLLLPYIFRSFYSSLLYTLYSTIFLEFYTLLGDLVFSRLLGRLYLLEGLNSNIRGREKTGDKVLTSLRGDLGGLLASIYK